MPVKTKDKINDFSITSISMLNRSYLTEKLHTYTIHMNTVLYITINKKVLLQFTKMLIFLQFIRLEIL